LREIKKGQLWPFLGEQMENKDIESWYAKKLQESENDLQEICIRNLYKYFLSLPESQRFKAFAYQQNIEKNWGDTPESRQKFIADEAKGLADSLVDAFSDIIAICELERIKRL